MLSEYVGPELWPDNSSAALTAKAFDAPALMQAAATLPDLNTALLSQAQQALREDPELQRDAGDSATADLAQL